MPVRCSNSLEENVSLVICIPLHGSGRGHLIPISQPYQRQDAPGLDDAHRTDHSRQGAHSILEFGPATASVDLDSHVDLCGHKPVSKVIVDLFAIEQMQFHRRADGEEPLAIEQTTVGVDGMRRRNLSSTGAATPPSQTPFSSALEQHGLPSNDAVAAPMTSP